MEGLSRFIYEERNAGRVKGVNIVANITLTHLLFIDDVLIFMNGAINDTIVVNLNLKIVYNVIGMASNHEKSTLSSTGCT